jgi:oligo-1,6-glucosidase/alpha-glucosidase
MVEARTAATHIEDNWWQRTTIYQIYPRSFQDSNGNGIGDLRGIIERIDYIQELGFETIWFSPFFTSPQGDFGYDVSDYYGVAAEYGTLADVEDLIQAVHQRGMRAIFDLVLNHTSIEHPWFVDSRSSRDSAKRNWYIWREGRGNRPPNNWKAIPGGSAWQYDDTTQQWYLASFLPFQPDLNWRNPHVQQAMFDVLKFWLDKGADGFRLDIFHAVYKDVQLRDNPWALKLVPDEENSGGFFQAWKYNLNQPEAFQLAVELRKVADSYTPERMLIGEVFGDTATLHRYLGEQGDGLNLVFLWDTLQPHWRADYFRRIIAQYEIEYPEPYTPVYVFGNHDQKRVRTKLGIGMGALKLLAVLQLTVRGVPVVYYGEEIGMLDGGFPARVALDPLGKRFAWVPEWLLAVLRLYVNRDGCRTPMQWDGSANAGFCPDDVASWLPVKADHIAENVSAQQAAAGSLLSTYKALLSLRRDHPALQGGRLSLLDEGYGSPDVLAYIRESAAERLLVALNFGERAVELETQGLIDILLEVGASAMEGPNRVQLGPVSALIASLN